MPSVFKPITVKPLPRKHAIRTIDGIQYACWTNRKHQKVQAELTADGTKCRVESPNWRIEYKNADGKFVRTKGFRDKNASLKLGFEKEREAEDIRSGRVAPQKALTVHLIDHLPDFQLHLETKGNSKPHVASVVHNVHAVIDGVRITLATNVNCERVIDWLTRERKRLNWSVANLNRYVGFLRQFGKWLVKSKRAKYNPFDELEKVKSNGEKTRNRRRLPDEEFKLLITAANESPKKLESLSGPNRARLYLLAAYTGFRIGSLAKLTPESFTWQGTCPVAVNASGRIVKNKKPHTVPLHPDVARILANWLSELSPGQPIFPPGNWSERGADLVEHDLSVARLAWLEQSGSAGERSRREASDVLKVHNGAGEVFDFHALRVQFISGLALAGVPLTAAQQLADHSTPMLTANIYTRWGKSEMAEQVAKLPGFGGGLQASVRGPGVEGSPIARTKLNRFSKSRKATNRKTA